MKIIKKLKGFSSEVFLVELKGVKYVLKNCDYDEVVSAKAFNKELAKIGIKTLLFYKYEGLNKNEILLEYIEGSKTLGDNFTEINCKKWGTITRKIHNQKFKKCFKYDNNGKKVELIWSDYLEFKINKAFTKSAENGNYGFNKHKLKKIKEYLKPLSTIEPEHFSLIHGDLHTGNILIKNKTLIPFDKNPEVFTGDYLLDLAIAIIDMPNGTLIHGDNPEYKNDKKCLNAFIKGYGQNFLTDSNLNIYIMLIAFGRLYTPFSANYKAIIHNLLEKRSE